mmetsp:Transcript_82494/g.230025  ORF Transcript_82494/g.230025 Transcript_82494/m.230025 type:complete len:235 (+) Transcript_82494:1055-1759(+)
MAAKVLGHLLSAILDAHFVPEVTPIAHEEIQGLEGRLDLGLLVFSGLTSAPEIFQDLAQCGLCEARKVGDVLHLVLLDLLLNVVDLLGRQQPRETEDGRGLLLGHVRVPRALRVHQDECDLLAIDVPEKWLRPDPDALSTHVHATFEPEALGVAELRALDEITCFGDPSWQWKVLGAMLWSDFWVWLLVAERQLLLVAQETEEQVEEERLPSAEGSHHRDHRDLLVAHLPHALL